MNDDSISDTIAAKSDQLNADDLFGGPITVIITGWKRGATQEQPVRLDITGHMPYFPCKSMRRVLVAEWGKMPQDWTGRSLTLYRDPSVIFGGVQVGGIRISHMSHTKEAVTKYMLTVSRGKKAPHTVTRLAPQDAVTDTEATIRTLRAAVMDSWPESSKEERAAMYIAWGIDDPRVASQFSKEAIAKIQAAIKLRREVAS